MKNILVISGSRADYGMLEWPIRELKKEFEVALLKVWGHGFDAAFLGVARFLLNNRPDCMIVLGDRFEILAAVTAAHLQRVPVAHIAGGDVTEGSYDDAMRDCISRMAAVHFVTSTSAMTRLTHLGCRNVHLVGNPGIDYIRKEKWKKERPIAGPYVVVSYQPETIDNDAEGSKFWATLPQDKVRVFILPNPDLGSDAVRQYIGQIKTEKDFVYESLPHPEFLNLLAHCDEFIGNSSAMLYEAPELKIKTRMWGKRQRGRTIPMSDGNASKRIVNILKFTAL